MPTRLRVKGVKGMVYEHMIINFEILVSNALFKNLSFSVGGILMVYACLMGIWKSSVSCQKGVSGILKFLQSMEWFQMLQGLEIHRFCISFLLFVKSNKRVSNVLLSHQILKILL